MFRYAKIRKMDVSDGPGIRISIYTQGCTHYCYNCFNQETWDFNGGQEWTDLDNNIILNLLSEDKIHGLSILGGDPLCMYENRFENKFNDDENMLLKLLVKCKESQPNKSIWLWTGFLWEELVKEKDDFFHKEIKKILPYIDVIIDGPYMESKRNLRLPYSGSTNQRVIDVQKSLRDKKIILYES